MVGLRDVAREAVREQVRAVALQLFDDRGFDAVTVEEIASAAGISPRSFHRYFPTKEDAVLGELAPYGELIRAAFVARPATEPVWTSLRLALRSMLDQSAGDPATSKRVMRVSTTTPSLQARSLEKHLRWATLLVPVVADRLTGMDVPLRARATVEAAIACFTVALTTWGDLDDASTPGELLDRTFAALGPVDSPTPVSQH